MAKPIDRRRFLAGATAATAGGLLLPRWAWAAPADARQAARRTARVVTDATGTTLESTIVPTGPGPYLRLTDGPGWPIVVRSELATPQAGREDRRRNLAVIAQLTDLHLVDSESPGRVEFIDEENPLFSAAYRAQETLSVHVAASMVARINAVARGPVTGRTIDCAVSTGDNTDNCQQNELDWFVSVLDGTTVRPTSGDPDRYEGVQDTTDRHLRYWHPDERINDLWKLQHGYPDVPGLLEAAIRPVTSAGLAMPWYSTFGNHDGNVQGNLAPNRYFDAIATGPRKITDLKFGVGGLDFVIQLASNPAQVSADVAAGRYPTRPVTADPLRRSLTPTSWVQTHLDSPTGNHGYTDDHLTGEQLYYSFEVAPGVLGISLDTCNHFGGLDGASGSIGESQLRWMEREIQRVSTRWLAADGTQVVGDGPDGDQVVLIFSHHTGDTMTAVDPDPARPDERRIQGPELITTLLRYPNVAAWVNGHTHANGIEPRPDPTGRTGGFWEIQTASHIDWPEHARIIELTDNADGTLSLHCTMLEHAAPAATDYSDLSLLGLAAISRELGANDPQIDRVGKLGGPEVRNVELLVPAPSIRPGAPAPPTTVATTTTGPPPSTTPVISQPGYQAPPAVAVPMPATFTG